MPSQHPRRRAIALFTAGVAAALLSACSVSDAETTGLTAAPTTETASENTPAAPPKLSVADGATDVEPGAGVKVTSKSEMQTVTLTDAQGNEVDGEFNSDDTEWESAEDLKYGIKYTLKARVAGGKRRRQPLPPRTQVRRPTLALVRSTVQRWVSRRQSRSASATQSRTRRPPKRRSQ